MPLFVGIAGPSGAGKSTLARLLMDRLPQDASLFSLDWYYNDESRRSVEERAAINFDHPEALDWERFFDDFMLLESGARAEAPVYDFSKHLRLPETQPIEPRAVVIVEGLHVLWQPALRAMLNFKVYIKTSQSVCLKRRIDRDTTDRGRSAGEVIRQYKTHTNPMFLEFIEPSMAYADLVIEGETDFQAEAERLSRQLM